MLSTLARTVLLVGAAATATAASGCGELDASRSGGSESGGGTVVSVADGDTITVQKGGENLKVRLLQIDAPESSALRYDYAQCGGDEAKSYVEKLLPKGTRITLEYAGRDRTDRYDRQLAIVRLGSSDGPIVQEKILQAGWAQVYVFRGDRTRYFEQLTRAARQAKQARVGVYAICGGDFDRRAG
jgi:micrococcal nuclease